LNAWPVISPDALITDVGSTNGILDAHAPLRHKQRNAFLADIHGRKEHSGWRTLSKLFLNAVWLLVRNDQSWTKARSSSTATAGKNRRARVKMDPERHDRICAWISHVPQMIPPRWRVAGGRIR